SNGYFNRTNQLSRSISSTSNEKEILFIDIYKYYMDNSAVMGTIAHEFSHMVMFNEAYSLENGMLKGLANWLEEGITQYMQFIYNGKYSPNLDVFINNPDVTLVDDRDSVWNGSNPFANYGASFLWTYYVIEKYGYANIPNFLKAVVRAKVDGGIGNYDSVLKASNTTFQKVFQDWIVANYLDKCYKSDGVTLLNEGKWGYKVDCDKDTSNDIGYSQKLPVPANESFTLSGEMNTRAGSVNSWAGDCIQLSGNNGNLNIAFDGSDNGTFACAVVKKGTSVDTTCEFMTLDAKQAGNLVVQNYGTTGTYETILLIPMVCSNYNYEKLSYVYSGSFDDLKVAIFPNPIFENFLHIIVRTEKEFASEPRVQMTYNGKQGYLVMSPVNSSTYMTNYTVTADGEGTIVCSGTNKNGVILSNSLNFSASYYARGSSGSLSASYAVVDIPKGALSADGTIVLASSNNDTSYEGIVRMSKNVDLALPVDQADKDLQITIPVNSEVSVDNSKAGLYRATTSGHKWVGPVTLSDGKAKGNIGVSASLFIAADETAPVISNKLEARGNGKYAVKVSDVGSGICSDTVKVTCDGKALKSTFADDVVVFDTSEYKSSSKIITVEAADNSGNVARASMRANIGANALSQITAWPNPAKNHSVIRATITGANVNGGTGSVKIYDVSGHKVMDGAMVEGAGGVYEFDWNLANKKNKGVANGVYFAEVKLNVAGNSYKERIKIAVLR
ncbi:MAG: T9SS type A sorting domain-containing protein, partial [Candidatus Riflebacteria bacterium]|nr:T9SS type A sorting domain-containing protein [Candidatus Riflebacteria bacterium]